MTMDKQAEEVITASEQERLDEAARAGGSVKDDITPEPHPVRDAIEDLIPGDSDGDGH